MPRIKFLKDFDYKPVPQQTYAYKAGDIALVKQEEADQAIKEGKAELIEFGAPPSGISNRLNKFHKPKKKTIKTTEEINRQISEGSPVIEESEKEQTVEQLLENPDFIQEDIS